MDVPPGGAAAPVRCDACDAGIRRAFDFLGKRWNGVDPGHAQRRSGGFADLRRGVGTITDSVLSDRLAELSRPVSSSAP